MSALAVTCSWREMAPAICLDQWSLFRRDRQPVDLRCLEKPNCICCACIPNTVGAMTVAQVLYRNHGFARVPPLDFVRGDRTFQVFAREI